MEQRNGGILITGGTGFLGRALARRLLHTCETHRVCIYSRSEHAQAQMLDDFRHDPRLRMFIGDVRDRDRLTWAMRSVDWVIHAAALKRIEVGFYNPGEMVRTNVLGAMNAVEAAINAGWPKRVVLVSTDKAYQPVSPYGLSKAMAESIFLAANNTVAPGGPSFAVCRYGNVAGSTGSIIPKWRALLEQDQPIQVTDPDCTRFWMTADDAVDLVLKTMHGAEQMRVPDLPAFRIGDLAEAMGAGRGYPIVRTELPAWEKKHETLKPGMSSDTAPRMTVEQLRQALAHV